MLRHLWEELPHRSPHVLLRLAALLGGVIEYNTSTGQNLGQSTVLALLCEDTFFDITTSLEGVLQLLACIFDDVGLEVVPDPVDVV
jgi:hypothetical protein